MATEIGDKTFLIAAIMSMKNPRSVIFSGAISALALMTVLSAYLGHVFTALISKKYTQLLAAILFVIFGLKMLKEAYEMTGDQGQEELKEVQAELLHNDSEQSLVEMESGGVTENSSVRSTGKVIHEGVTNLMNYFFTPVFVQVFILTFLAEWGDRSQIATIALAGSKDWFLVSVGCLVAHSICTGIAVIGGQLIATKISVKTMTFTGGFLFIVFGILSFYESQLEN